MNLRIAAALAFSLAAIASPVAAAQLGGMGAAIYGNAFSFKKANLDTVPVQSIEVGGLKVVLQRTKLKDIQKVLGGTIQRQGEGASRADWLCYAGGGQNVWFIANSLGGYEFVMMVAAEASGKAAGGCDASDKLGALKFGIPGLGASSAELKTAFGAAPAKSGKVSYRADEPGADALGTAMNAQYIGYTLAGGKVTGIGIGETSVQMAK